MNKFFIFLILCLNVSLAGLPPLPSQYGNSGKFLTTNGIKTSWVLPSSGGGNGIGMGKLLGSCTMQFTSGAPGNNTTSYAMSNAGALVSSSSTGNGSYPGGLYPACTFSNLSAGKYQITFTGNFGGPTSSASAGEKVYFAFYDGANYSDETVLTRGDEANNSTGHRKMYYQGNFSYDVSRSSLTIYPVCKVEVSGHSCTFTTGANLTIRIYRYQYTSLIKKFTDFRSWDDGTSAATCSEYLNPTIPSYKYSGDNAIGRYRLYDPNTQISTYTTCPSNADTSAAISGNNIASAAWAVCTNTDGVVYCSGRNNAGFFGNGDSSLTTNPIPINTGLTGITKFVMSRGSEFGCYIKNKALYCFGNNTYGQIGNGTTGGTVSMPYQVFSSGVTDISLGYYHACAIKSSSVYCWGLNKYGALGRGFGSSTDNTTYPTPAVISGLSGSATSVYLERYVSCAISSYSDAYCWGDTTYGRGDGTYAADNSQTTPYLVSSSVGTVQEIAPGAFAHCLLNSSGEVYCWGTANLIGNGNTGSSIIPTATKVINSGAKKITGFTSKCAIVNEWIKCWGTNSSGQLGVGDTSMRYVPTDVSGYASGIVALDIKGGTNLYCAKFSNGEKCWGNNDYGTLASGGSYGTGDGSVYYTVPTKRIPYPFQIKNFGQYRAWDDGTYATSCDQYKNPTNLNYKYGGDTGSGKYRISMNNTTYDVYCYMTFDQYGYVRIAGMQSGVRSSIGLSDEVYSDFNNFLSSDLIRYYPVDTSRAIYEKLYTGACNLPYQPLNGIHLIYGPGVVTLSYTSTSAYYVSIAYNNEYSLIGSRGVVYNLRPYSTLEQSGSYKSAGYSKSGISGNYEHLYDYTTVCSSSDYFYLYVK